MHESSGRQQVNLLRIVDAAANRALEGLRVVEDVVRFAWNDRHLTERCKQLRHRIAQVLDSVDSLTRLRARDTETDVGVDIRTEREAARSDLQEILRANFRRTQEALRSLAECFKNLQPEQAEVFERARYELYTLERAVAMTGRSLEVLARARLYVLVGGGVSDSEFASRVKLLVDEKVDVIQLRDKTLGDRVLMSRAAILKSLTRHAATLAIINDRPDVAALSEADGVHVGQDELTVAQVRAIVGPVPLVGVSTHSIEQARQAVLDGADYLGVGPIFDSRTKLFDSLPGLPLLRAVADEIRLPAFAIGGIEPRNLAQVADCGISRVAVQGAISQSTDPRATIRSLREALARPANH